MSLGLGDRIRVEETGDDGLPLVRYGFVAGPLGEQGSLVVMLDGDLGCTEVPCSCVAPVQVTTVELALPGPELFDDPCLRSGLLRMWQAEAEQAGIAVDAVHPVGEHTAGGLRDANDSWALAEVMSGGEQYVVRALTSVDEPGLVRVRADRPNRWEW